MFEDFEPNNTFAQAHPLSEGTVEVAGQGVDWFSVTSPRGDMTFTMTPANGDDLNLELYNSNMQVVQTNFQPGQEVINFSTLSSEQFFLRVVKPGDEAGSTQYTLSVDLPAEQQFDFEPNDTIEQAQTLSSGTFDVTSQGTNWFRVDSPPGEFSVTVTPTDGTDINIAQVLNGNQQVIGGSLNPGTATETVTHTSSTSETYFIEVSPAAFNVAEYTMEVTLPDASSFSTELDLGPIRDVSVSLFDIDEDGQEEIFVGTSKKLDGAFNEVLPAGLAVLEPDGSVKWIKQFPAIAGPDPQTGKTYSSTSVSTPPTFADVDDDGSIDILVGVGADTQGEVSSDLSGQPGDKGGVYALTASGEEIWFHQSRDIIGGTDNTGEGRPDGVYGAPVVFDIDTDGVKEVIYNSWDQSTWILDGRTGEAEGEVHLADTIWSRPAVADIDENGHFEILVSADITANPDAETQTGGIFHVLRPDGSQTVPGFDQPVGNPDFTQLRGKFEEQTLWSSPITDDLDGDGHLEIVYGTGNFFKDDRGSFIRVWNHDGSNKFQLDTQGRTLATPLVADIDGDGDKEIVATTLDGYVYGWDHLGQPLFANQIESIDGSNGNPIFGSPIAVDLNGNGTQEILFSQGSQMVIVDHTGQQLTDPASRKFVFESFKGAPAVSDIDDDGQIDIISGGTTPEQDRAVVYRWANPFEGNADDLGDGRHQFHQSMTNLRSFVERFFEIILNREPDPSGFNDWVEGLNTGVRTGADVARGFILSPEFTGRNTSDEEFVTVLFEAFFGRAPDDAGFNDWLGQLEAGTPRESVLEGFINSQEFRNLAASFSILPTR